MPWSVSVTVTSENLTVIGGLHSGWKLAVRVLPSDTDELRLLPAARTPILIRRGVAGERRSAPLPGLARSR
jgi:hypothetical protein